MNNKIISVVLCTLLLMSCLTGCGTNNKEDKILSAKSDVIESETQMTKDEKNSIMEFGIRLFQQGYDKNRNSLISPISVIYALAMTTNGAKEETLSQMETVLGMSVDELNHTLLAYAKELPDNEETKLSIANAIWMNKKDGLSINENFLKKCTDYYDADIFKDNFNDGTCKDINNWVDKKTDGMIEKIVDRMSEETVMYLVNALTFDSKWEDTYKDDHVREDIFTTEDGKQQKVKFMYSDESKYITGDCADGFIKYYKGRDYAFVGLLPHAEVKLESLITALDAKKLTEMLEQSIDTKVHAAIPKYDSDYSIELSTVLSNMGMPLAFSKENANFDNLATSDRGPVFIGKVIHKTFISVTEKGVKAGAATAVQMEANSCPAVNDGITIYLNRPFIYMLIDTTTNLPLFIGTVSNLGE